MGNSSKKLANPAVASFWYTACSIAQKGISVIMIPLYVRLMSTEQYGTYTLFQSWSGIVLIFTTLNLAAYAFNNCLIQNEEKKDWVTGVFLGLICTLTTFVAVIFLVFLKQWESVFGLTGKYVLALVLDSSFTVCIDLWYARQKFEYRYQGVVVVTLLISVMNLLCGYLAVSSSVDKAFAAILGKICVQGLITCILAISIWSKSKQFYNKKIWIYALSFNIPLIPHFLSTRVLQQLDRIMIERLCGLTDAAIYGFSYKISECMLIFNAAFLASLIPWTYRKLKESKFNEINNKAFLTVLLIGILNIMLIILAPEVVMILGTEEYYQAVYIIPPVACSCFLMYLFNVFVNVTYYYGKNRLVVAASVGAALFNFILNYIFIPKFGYLAAGYTTLASYMLLSFMHYIMQKHTLKLEGIDQQAYNGKKILFVSIGIIVLGCGASILYPHKFIRYLIVALFVVITVLKKDVIISLVKQDR